MVSARRFLPSELVSQRRREAGEIIALLTANILTLERKAQQEPRR